MSHHTTGNSVGADHWLTPGNSNCGVMVLHHDSEASADTKRPDTASAGARSLSNRFSVPRAAMTGLDVQCRARHPDRRRRSLASFPSRQGHKALPAASFSPTAYRPRHGLFFSWSRRMRSLLRAVRVLSGNSARADRPFFPDRSRSLWRHLPPGRRCADVACSVLLERNPPNLPLVPAGTPALGRESNPAPQK